MHDLDPEYYAVCCERITSPIADEVGMKPNLECGSVVRVRVPEGGPCDGWVAHVRCHRGHSFLVEGDDLLTHMAVEERVG